MSRSEKVMEMIKEHDVKYVDFRFTDPRGKWQHLAHHITDDQRRLPRRRRDVRRLVDRRLEGDQRERHAADAGLHDRGARSVRGADLADHLFCDVHEPGTGQPYGRDPRSIAKKAEKYLASTGIGDTAYFGPEAEFFVFDDVRYKVGMQRGVLRDRQPRRGPYVTDKKFPDGNTGHRPPIKGGYFPVPPVDGTSDLRAEMLSTMAEMGLNVEKHHHEVAPSQHELGAVFHDAGQGRRRHADLQIRRAQRSRISTARPRPSCRSRSRATTARACTCTSRSGRATSRSSPARAMPISRDIALYYIGGIIKHAKAINAFTNPTTNSYKRLIPGFEAPVLLAYSARNRSASCRIPIVSSPKGKRVEVRFPDPACQPLSRLRGDADGGPRRHPEPHPSRRRRWTRTSTTCRRRS